jgi:hypothetical protein
MKKILLMIVVLFTLNLSAQIENSVEFYKSRIDTMFVDTYNENNEIIADSAFSINRILITIDDDKILLETATTNTKYFIISREVIDGGTFYKVRDEKNIRCNILVSDLFRIRYFDVEYYINVKKIN